MNKLNLFFKLNMMLKFHTQMAQKYPRRETSKLRESSSLKYRKKLRRNQVEDLIVSKKSSLLLWYSAHDILEFQKRGQLQSVQTNYRLQDHNLNRFSQDSLDGRIRRRMYFHRIQYRYLAILKMSIHVRN